MTVRPAKTQISLVIHPVWSEYWVCAQCVAKDPSFLHVDSEDSVLTGRMPKLIWVFAVCTCHFVGFLMRRLNYVIYWVPLPKQLYFFLSIFKTDNNLKNSMTNYHLHSMSIFLHYQIRFSCSHARVLAFEYKSASSVLHLHMLIFSINLYTVKLMEDRPVSVCTVKCPNSQRNARNLVTLSVPVRRMFLRDRHHCAKRSTPLQLSSVCFYLAKAKWSY